MKLHDSWDQVKDKRGFSHRHIRNSTHANRSMNMFTDIKYRRKQTPLLLLLLLLLLLPLLPPRLPRLLLSLSVTHDTNSRAAPTTGVRCCSQEGILAIF